MVQELVFVPYGGTCSIFLAHNYFSGTVLLPVSTGEPALDCGGEDTAGGGPATPGGDIVCVPYGGGPWILVGENTSALVGDVDCA